MELQKLTEEERKKYIPDETFLLGYMGSHSHGTYMPKKGSIDDIDLMGVCKLPIEQYLGLGRNPVLVKRNKEMNNEVQEIQEGVWDIVVYDIKKYFNLLLKQNPNVVGLLWLPEHLYMEINDFGKKIIENRDIFVSKEIYNPFIGYAKDQYYKMEHMAFNGYMGQKRKDLYDKFGYDTKNAAHLIRLLKMFIEFLDEGKMNVYRQDAEMLRC